MKNDTAATAARKRLAALIEGIEIAMLTTRTTDGSMVSRPVQTLQFNGGVELVFFTAANSTKVDELTEHPDVLLSYADPQQGRFVSVRGMASIDRDAATIEALWTPIQRVFFPAGKTDPNLVILRVQLRDAAWWQPAGNFVMRTLDLVRGFISDEPEDLGKHGVIQP